MGGRARLPGLDRPDLHAQAQEFIVLSDVFGITIFVDSTNHPRGSQAAQNSVVRLFYQDGRPVCLRCRHLRRLSGAPLLFHAMVVDGKAHLSPVQRSTSGTLRHRAAAARLVLGLTGMCGLVRIGDTGDMTVRSIIPAPPTLSRPVVRTVT
ncbi:hypothetical protein [Amycolatopsis sp. FDAARGOS 1241]|uniref:hypothetical protein n=1 Tax=Amycolatopsis sp. FDAARGOS 1241 TaxID=2778070 RepID=UPI001EF1D40C|nr:hypothetical protein [Amycolatopsis sp. FDAARGOS 1241]